jgi:hypothetical protein
LPGKRTVDLIDNDIEDIFDDEDEDFEFDDDLDFEEDDSLCLIDSEQGEYLRDTSDDLKRGYYPYYKNKSERYDDEY